MICFTSDTSSDISYIICSTLTILQDTTASHTSEAPVLPQCCSFASDFNTVLWDFFYSRSVCYCWLFMNLLKTALLLMLSCVICLALALQSTASQERLVPPYEPIAGLFIHGHQPSRASEGNPLTLSAMGIFTISDTAYTSYNLILRQKHTLIDY